VERGKTGKNTGKWKRENLMEKDGKRWKRWKKLGREGPQPAP
jgi:hypothetical protein